MSLYDIDNNIRALMDGANEECINPDTGEFYEDKFFELMERYSAERAVKIENIALYIKNLAAEAEAIKLEEKTLADRRKSKEAKAERLKTYLTQSLIGSGDEKFESAKCALSFRKSEVVIADLEKLPEEYIKTKTTYEPDKTAIKKAIKAGAEIIGAALEEKKNLQIK